MKKIILILSIILSIEITAESKILNNSSPTEIQSDFCDGWESGYISGYHYGETFRRLDPLVPLCPFPYINRDTYKDGYERGFVAGMNADK